MATLIVSYDNFTIVSDEEDIELLSGQTQLESGDEEKELYLNLINGLMLTIDVGVTELEVEVPERIIDEVFGSGEVPEEVDYLNQYAKSLVRLLNISHVSEYVEEDESMTGSSQGEDEEEEEEDENEN